MLKAVKQFSSWKEFYNRGKYTETVTKKAFRIFPLDVIELSPLRNNFSNTFQKLDITEHLVSAAKWNNLLLSSLTLLNNFQANSGFKYWNGFVQLRSEKEQN